MTMSQVKHNGLSFGHLLDSRDVTVEDIEKITSLATTYRAATKAGTRQWREMEGYILATLFFEPSTRTRFSFEAAMLRLGGQVISLEHGFSSSLKKGETLADTGRVMSGYADLVVIRHPDIGSAAALAETSLVPVISGGDGSNQHPTQALVDLYTIKVEKGRLDNLTIGVVGDLKYSRTSRSLLGLMSLYPNNRFVLISHPTLRLPAEDRKDLKGDLTETESLADVIHDLDVLYVTRVQEERFASKEDYMSVKDNFIITPASLIHAKKDLTLMHPLPRVNEITPDVDKLPQAKYFQQADRNIFVRMALLTLMKTPGPSGTLS